jgi:hypothetical protein
MAASGESTVSNVDPLRFSVVVHCEVRRLQAET